MTNEFWAQGKINNFMLYIYSPDHSSYWGITGTKSGNSISFTMQKSTGKWVLAVQYLTNRADIPKIEQVKFECGNKATAWLPSSEDFANMAKKIK